MFLMSNEKLFGFKAELILRDLARNSFRVTGPVYTHANALRIPEQLLHDQLPLLRFCSIKCLNVDAGQDATRDRRGEREETGKAWCVLKERVNVQNSSSTTKVRLTFSLITGFTGPPDG